MNKSSLLAFVAIALGSAGSGLAAPCVQQTLGYYKATYGELNACSVGVLTYYSFDFAKLSAFGSVTENDIIVTPDAPTNTLLFSGATAGTFNHTINAGQAEQYLLSYVIDPPPIVAGDDLSLDPPTGPIYVSRWSCTNQPFSQTPGAGSIAGQGVGTYSTAYKCLDGSNPYFLQVSPQTQLSASVAFTPAATFVFSRMAIDLLPGTVTGLDAVVSQTQTIPEPGTAIPAALALAGMAMYRLRRR